MATALCYEKLHEEALKQYESDEAFIKAFVRSYGGHSVRATDIKGDESKVNIDSLLYNQRCVFTGKLEKFTRKEAMQIVAVSCTPFEGQKLLVYNKNIRT